MCLTVHRAPQALISFWCFRWVGRESRYVLVYHSSTLLAVCRYTSRCKVLPRARLLLLQVTVYVGLRGCPQRDYGGMLSATGDVHALTAAQALHP